MALFITGKLPITVLIATKNEEANIGRCLAALSPAQKVIVIDSHSVDSTVQISKEVGAEVVQFQYRGGYPKKLQWALDNLKIETPWVLLIDADEVIPEDLWNEIHQNISNSNAHVAYMITKGFHFLGRRFRFGGFSHSAVILFRKGLARFEQILDESSDSFDMEIHHRMIVNGSIGKLKTPLIHEDFKGLTAYIDRHNRYSSWEARVRNNFIKTGRWGKDTIKPHLFGGAQERRRFLKTLAIRIPFEPQLWFLYHYVLRLGFLEGRPGLIASQVRASYIAQVRAKLYELHQHQKEKSDYRLLENKK
jgi:glycosyltransferase involved in cell wall biosynthesis